MKRATRVLHLLDPTITWDQRLALEQLLDGLPGERFEQRLASLGPLGGEAARVEAPVDRLRHRFHVDFLTAPVLRRFLGHHRIDLIHAWGTRAFRLGATTSQDRLPVIGSVVDPAQADTYAKVLRTARSAAPVAVLCATEIVRRRVIERGGSRDETVLVRPGLDFATINRARKSNLRARLGLGADTIVLLTDPLANGDRGHFSAVWATAVRSFLEPSVRLVVPGCARDVARLRRLAHALEQTHVLVTPGDRYRFEELIAVGDVLLIAGTAESSVTAITWAMGVGVPVIACATRATAELLTHDHNAFLIKPDAAKRLAMRFADAVGRRHGWNRLTQTARSQAYTVFSLRRCIDQTQRVYDNLLDNRLPADGITDPAIVD